MSVFKRSACDRCRSKKLRCERTEQNNCRDSTNPDAEPALEPCVRCLVMDAECTTTINIPGTTSSPNTWMLSPITFNALEPPPCDLARSDEQYCVAVSVAPSKSIANSSEHVNASDLTTRGHGPAQWLDPAGANHNDHFGSSWNGERCSPSDTALVDEFLQDMDADAYSLAIPSTGYASSETQCHATQTCPSISPTRNGTLDSSNRARSWPCSGENLPDLHVRLSRLSLRLSQHLLQATPTTSGDAAAAHADLLATYDTRSDVLHSACEFIAILTQLERQAGSPDMVTLLVLLTCYVQLVAMHADLLMRVSQHKQWWLPSLELEGVSMQCDELRAKVFAQVVEHQFEAIERILGLPVEYSVSSRRLGHIHAPGLLCKWETGELLRGVVETGRVELDNVAILKDHIQRLKQSG